MKLITRTHLAYFLLLFFIIFSSEVTARGLLMDNKEFCENDKGLWREFGNNCADECYGKDRLSVSCPNNIVFGCDCGNRRCWNDGKCVSEKKYIDSIKEKDKTQSGQYTRKGDSETGSKSDSDSETDPKDNKQKMCKDSGGVWREFADTCANNCNNGLGMMPLCSATLINSCDCGNGKCWNNNKCIGVVDYINDNLLH